MTALLTDHVPLLAGSPNGIQKLRELILELAMRGKLVLQDPNDEPASELLKRIAEERTQLATGGKIKKKPLGHVTGDDVPFDLPKSWQWARLGDLSELITSGSRDWAQHYSDEGAIFVRMGNLSRCSYELRLNSIQRVLPPERGEGRRTKLEPGDLLLSITGEVGLLGLIPENFGEAYINQHVCLIRFFCSVRSRFLPEALRSPLAYKQYEAPQRGIKNSFRLGDVSEILVPLPPLSEQYRIVAKIDELMALCDRLEDQQADADSAHIQLVQALLNSLTQANSVTDFSANWQRLSKHFHTLFTTESSIDVLKQTLLHLAVMGKLVPQQLSDEPANELISRIDAEKKRLMADERLRTTARENVEADEQYIEPRSGWKYCRLGNLARFIDYRGRTPTKTSSGIPLITAKNVRVGFISREPREFIAEADYSVWMTRGVPRLGDMLFTTEAPMGNIALIDIAERFALAQRVICFQLHEPKIGPFLKLVIMSAIFQRKLLDVATGMTATGIKSSRLKDIPILLPPLSEQYRIVAKVDQLMTLCDRLKVQLTQKRLLSEKITAALVGRVLIDEGRAFNSPIDKGGARVLLAAEIVQQLHREKRMGRVKLQKVISLAEHVARLKEIQSDEERYAAGPHDPALMRQVREGLRSRQWFDELDLDGGKRHEYHPLAEAGAHRADYEALWSTEQRQQISLLIELVRSWDTARCERVSTLYSAWNDLLIEGREATDAAILKEVLQRWHDNKKKFTEEVWMAELAAMKTHILLAPTGFGKRTRGGIFSLI